MNVLRKVVAVTLMFIVSGILLGRECSLQQVPCYASGLPAVEYHNSCGHGVIPEKSSVSKYACFQGNNYEYGPSFNTAPFGDGLAQLIDLENEGPVTYDGHSLEGKTSSPKNSSIFHYVKVSFTFLPLYLLKSSFLL